MTIPRARPRRDEGQASVEVALLLPLVVLLLLAILQIGLLARDAILVSHASREGARAAATDPTPGAAAAAAREGGGLDPERMDVAVTGSRTPGGRIRVTVTYRAPTEVPLIGSLLGEPAMRSSTTMRVEGPAPRRPDRGAKAAKGDEQVSRTTHSRALPLAWQDSHTARRNGSGERSGTCGGRALDFGGPSVSRRTTTSHPSSGSGGTFWRIQHTCSSERLPLLPAGRCWLS